jgi:hypothetical protein
LALLGIMGVLFTGCAGEDLAGEDLAVAEEAGGAPAAPEQSSEEHQVEPMDVRASALAVRQVPESNPAYVLGVRSYRMKTLQPLGTPTSTPVTTSAEALNASGVVLYTVEMQMRMDLMASWAQNEMNTKGTVGNPTAAQMSTFFGNLNITPANGALATDNAKARAGAGLIVVSQSGTSAASLGEAIQGLAAPSYCVSEEEAFGNLYSSWAALALCAVEIGVAVAAPGLWATLAVIAAESLAGGLGCGSVYGLLCDQMGMWYRSACCTKDDINYQNTYGYLKLVCPFGDPIPEPSVCEACDACPSSPYGDGLPTGWGKRCCCPAGSGGGSIWGTGLYTDDSRLCTAAVHSGAITAAAGGKITYFIQEGQSCYFGRTQNGVTSYRYGSWPRSFSVNGSQPPQKTPQEKFTGTYYYSRTSSPGSTTAASYATSCLDSPITLIIPGTEFSAVGKDGTKQVIDGVWSGYIWRGENHTTQACPAVCK